MEPGEFDVAHETESRLLTSSFLRPSNLNSHPIGPIEDLTCFSMTAQIQGESPEMCDVKDLIVGTLSKCWVPQ